MVRETRYLLIGNLPESTTENEIAEYFKRYGKIQKVKLERKPEDKDKESDEKDDGSGSSLTATVAFTDIKSASTAHKADKKIGNNLLSSDYSEGFGATGSVVTRTHEPEIYPRGAASATFSASRKGIEEEADGFDVYYGPTPQFNEPSYPSPNQFTERGRPRERWAAGSANYQGSHGGKWTGGANRPPYTDSSSKDGFEKPQTASIPASSPTHSMSHSSEKRHGKKKSKSVDQSRSSSRSSRSSSSSSDSGSASSSKERPKSAVVSTVPVRSDSQSVDDKAEAEIEPGEREPLGLLITKLPIRSSDSSLRDGLFHEYKKYGKITAVQISGVAETRYAIISFKQVEDAAKAFEASRDKRFFGTQIIVSQHEGIEVEDSEYCTPEAQLDEHSPKATRTLFLGNLEKEITIEELKEKLDKYGEILDVDVKRQGAVSAYAFIQFSDITSVVRALRDLDGCSWGTAKLKVGFGKSMATPVIWLDNLADTVNEGFLCRQFSRFGGISHTVVDRVKNRALIFFMNIESAQYALPEMRNRIWNGKKIHIDFASRDCQEAFFLKMEGSGQLRPGERPDQRWMHKQIQNDPYWDENMDATTTTPAPTSNPAMSPAAKRGTFTQGAAFTRGRARFTARGRGFFRGRGGSFEGHYTEEVTPGRRAKQVDEFSQGSATYMEDDSFEQELREYGHSQRERRERSSQSPPGYDEVYYENSQTTREYDQYEKAPARYEAYRSLSPSSDREVEVDEEYKYKTRTPSVERYYYKDKYYEESKSRDRSHSSDSEQRFRLSSEVAIRPTSRSRSPSAKHKRTKELPISYRSQSPPTPTDDEPAYYHDSSDHSPSDFDSAFRKYDYKKRLSTGSIDGDKKLLLTTGLRKEIEAKSEERSSRKRSYDQMSPKRSDSVHRIERQHSKGSRSGSLYDFDKTAMKDSKIARLKSEVHERGVSKDSPSSGSSISDIDPSTMSEAKLAKLHRKKQTLLDKLTLLEDTGNNSEGDSNGDTRHVVSKKARIDLNSQSRYLLKGEALTSKQIKERLKMIELKQSRKAETSRKKDLLREIKKSKSSDSKKDLLEYSEDENQSMHSPRDYPAGFMPKKRRKVEGEVDRKVRGYRSHANDDDQYSSEEERDKSDSVQRQISSHSDIYSRSRTGFSMDARLETEVFSQTRDESRRISSGSDTNKEHSEHASHRHRRHKHKKEDHITPLIPLGDDEMPDPETADPRVPKERVISPMLLPLPDFAQFIQFSPLPSPHPSPEHYSDLSTVDNRDKLGDSAAGGSNQPYQSPCFSPQSSSSKTHSPSDSPPSGSGSEVKANINSDSGDIPPGFPTETEQIDSLEGNKIDSLDNTSDPTKASANDSKEEHDSLSDNNSDSENCNLSSENLSIEERIRRLDEKWNQSQAVMAATPKVIPAVESLVNTSLSSSLSSSLTSSVFSSLSVASPITTTASPTVSAIYSKYRIRKKNEPSVGPERSEPSEIAQTILSKSSIFDQDSKRLGQIQDSLNSSKDFNTCGNDNSPKVFNSWDKTSDSNKELPMVTVPGSLMDRLGQSQNMSFPTLTVNNTFTNSANVPTSNKSEINLYPPSDPRLSRLSPSSYNNYSTSTNLRGVNKYDDGDSTPSILNDKVDSKETVFADQLDTKVSACDLKNDHHQESSYKDVDSSSSDRTNSVTDNYKCDIGNGVNASLDIKPNLDSLILVNNVKNESPVLPSVDIKVEKDVEKVNHNTGKSVDKNDLNMSVHSSGAIDSKMDTSEPVSEIKESHKGERLNSEKPLVKSEQSEPLKEHRTNNISETSSMPTSVSVGKRKIEDIKSDSDIESKSVKAESKTETITPIEVKPEPEQSKESKESVKTETKSASEKLNCSDKDKHANSSKSDKEASKEPSSKKQKTSSKDKHSDSAHKEDKHKKKDGEKKSESSHKSSSEKKDDKKEKHKSKADKDKKDAEKKSKDDKKESKDEKKKKSEKKEKKEEKKELKENKEEKKEKDKSEGSEKKEKDKSEKKEKEKHDKKEGHKHEKIKSPEKKTKTSHSKDSEIKDSSKENKESSLSAPKDTSNADNVSTDEGSKVPEKEKTDKEKEKSDKKKSEQTNKKEHKSSSSHKTKKSKEEDPEKKLKENKKNKDDHSEHKKKDDGHNRNSKDSPDKNKDGEKKETSEEKKNKSSEKSKENTADKCKEHKSKDKENKDKDPDVSKSKGKHGSNEGDKSRHQSGDKPKSEGEKVEEKKDNQKEEKKAKDADTSKTSSSSKNKEKSDSQKKSSEKSSKSSSKSKCNEAKSDSKSEKEKKEPKEKEKEKEKDSTPRKKECDAIVENGLTEEDMAIFAQFSEPYMSMYDKVKRRSTDKQIRTQQEQRVQKSLLHEYKRSAKRNNKKHSLSDITESSDVSSDEEKKKSKSKKKFTFSTNESDSSSEEDLLRKTSKTQSKKPKRILDIYSSDSEEEELQASSPSKKTSSKKKKNSEKPSKPIYDFDSISDSDNKTSSTKQARSKTAPKANKTKSKSKSDPNKPLKMDSKDGIKSTKPKTKDFLKNLFSDDSDDSLNSDSDSGSDILISAKIKKKPEPKRPEKKNLPKGSSIYTTSEESDTDDDFKPLSPPRSMTLPKSLEKKEIESDHLTSDADGPPKETKKSKKNNRKMNDSFDSDNMLSDPESIQMSKSYKLKEDIKLFEKINNDTILFGEERDKKLHKQKSKDKDKLHKDTEKNKINKILVHDIFSEGEQKLIKNLSSLEMTDVFHSTLYEKDKLPFNLTNKDNLPPILSDIRKEPLFKLDVESVRNDIPSLKDINGEDKKSGKSKSKKLKKENKKKKKNKEKPEKEKDNSKERSETSKPLLKSKSEHSLDSDDSKIEKIENMKPESESDMNVSGSSSARNLFEDMKSMKTPPNEGKKKKKKADQEKGEKHDLFSDSDFLSDTEKRKESKNDSHHEKSNNISLKSSDKSDIFDFREDEDSGFKPIKESHVKKADTFADNDKDDESPNVPIDIQDVEIEYQSEDHDARSVCPDVETSEVVIEQTPEEKPEKPKTKRKQKSLKADTSSTDPTFEAVSSLVKESKPTEEIQTDVVPLESPVSNEQELVIDEGVSLHVEDETNKAVDSIVVNEIDETALAVESILFDSVPTPFISEPVEPTPQLDQNYLQPEFGLPSNVPQVGTEVETTTATSTPVKGKKSRKSRKKSGQGDTLNDSSRDTSLDSKNTSSHGSKAYDLFEDSSTGTSFVSDALQDQNDDDDDGRLQIDFDPPKEPKLKKQRKPKQVKGKLTDAAALAAENKLDNLFGSFDKQKEEEVNRDSISSENSELERSKHEDLLVMDREDQRQDSDMMSPDERSTSDDLTSPLDGTKVVKPKRGRKPKAKDPSSMPIPRTNSPRSTRTQSPRSPRSADPKSPKFDLLDTKSTVVKGLTNDESLDKVTKSLTNVFDFDDNDETSSTSQTPAVTKQRKPRRKKGDVMQSPEHMHMFSPERKQEDKFTIGSPGAKVFSPEHKGILNNAFDKKCENLLSPLQPEEVKAEVKVALDDNKPPEPLFKAFFEGKKSEKDADRMNSVSKRIGSPPYSSQTMSNVDKTIEDVAKGLFESTDDEASSTDPAPQQKRRQSRKSKDEEASIKSPIPKSPMVKSPLPKSPMGKSPILNNLHSPPMSHHAPLVLPGMGQPQIGEPQLAGHVPMSSSVMSPHSIAVSLSSTQSQHMHHSPSIDASILSPKAAGLLSPRAAGMLSPKGLNESPVKSLQSSPLKTIPQTTSVITTVASSSSSTIVSASTASVVSNAKKADGVSQLETIKPSVPGVFHPVVCVPSSLPSMPTVPASVADILPNALVIADIQKKQMEKLAEQQSLIQQQKINDQKQAELQKQQEHHVKLKEQELKQMELERQKQIAEHHAKLQAQMQEREELEKLKNEQRKKQLQEHHKHLQQQFEKLQRQAAIQASQPPGQGPQQPLLSPGSMPRPTVPNNPDGQNVARPPLSAHHQMPPGAHFGLPGQHPVRPPFPAHLATQGPINPMHLVQPLAHDKTPTRDELALKHQQLQQQIAQQQAQALAEQQAQVAKQQAQQVQAQAKQQTQQSAAGKPAGVAPNQSQPGKPAPAQQQLTTKKNSPDMPQVAKGPAGAGQGNPMNRKDIILQRPPLNHNQSGGVPPPTHKDNQMPGSQEAANQLPAQLKQQIALSQHGHMPNMTNMPNMSQPHVGGPHPIPGWPMPPMVGPRPDGPPRQPGLQPGQALGPIEGRVSMPGPVPALGGNPQSVQRVSPHPPTKSPTVAQTAPNMTLGFSQHQTAAPRAPSPAVAKTAERPSPGGSKWSGSPGSQRPGQSEVRPRGPSTSETGPVSRPEPWVGINGPTTPGHPMGMTPLPRPAHQQPPSAHQQQPEHTLQLTRAPAPGELSAKLMQQQIQAEMQRRDEIQRQEMQRQQQLRDQVLSAQAQKEVQIHKERERAESLEREKREREVRGNLTSQSPSDARQAQALQRAMGGYPFVEPRPPSRDNGKVPQSPVMVDPRFAQQYPGPHPTDLRMGPTQTSAFSPAAGSSSDAAHMYTPAELQRIQQNGLIASFPPGLRILEPHMIASGHGPPYMIPGHIAYQMAQLEQQHHMVDGRPPSRGPSRPPSNQPVHTVSPTQTNPENRQPQNRQNAGGQIIPSRDPHPGDGSLLSLLQRYPVMWQGVMELKNEQCVVQMHFISGFQPLVKMSLPQQVPDGTVQPLRIAQRMRLEQTQLEGVAKRMQMDKDYCMMLALPCGRDHNDIYKQTRTMSTGFIQYLQQKHAAGIVNVADPGSQQAAYVVHIFPPCDFSQTTLSRLGFDLLYQVKDLAHLIVIIATVG